MTSVDFSARQDNRHLAKEKMVVVKLLFCKSRHSDFCSYFLNHFVGVSQTGARLAASGARLQSNTLSPLFPCFLSVSGDRRQGRRVSAAGSGAVERRLLTSATGRAVISPLSPLRRKKNTKKLRLKLGLQSMPVSSRMVDKKTTPAFNRSCARLTGRQFGDFCGKMKQKKIKFLACLFPHSFVSQWQYFHNVPHHLWECDTFL